MRAPLIIRAVLWAIVLWQSVAGVVEDARAEGMDRPLQELSRSSLLSVTPSYFDQDPRAPFKLQDDGVQHDALDFLVKSALPGSLTGEGQVAFSAFDSQRDKVYHEQKNRLLRFRLASDV